MRGILNCAGYIPFKRLERASIQEFMGRTVASGARSVASHDEDTATMGVEAARLVLNSWTGEDPETIWFSSSNPPYMEKTNANVLHAALQLPKSSRAYDFGGAVKSGVGALQTAVSSKETVLLIQADTRTGLPSGEDEILGGDAAAALLIGDHDDGPLLAQYLGGASATEEFIDRWRSPYEKNSQQWEERFTTSRYLLLVESAWEEALENAGLDPDEVQSVVISGSNVRVTNQIVKTLGVEKVLGDLTDSVGNVGAADACLRLIRAIESSNPGERLALVVASDGIEILIFEIADSYKQNPMTIDTQIATRSEVNYQLFLQWKGMLPVQPPNRPSPARISASAAVRESDWKHGFIASQGEQSNLIHMPPARVSASEKDDIDTMQPISMANTNGHIVTFTIDRLVYSESPPVVFAVVDFVGGGRMPMEVTDVDVESIHIGMEVVPTFRKIFTADGIHNYFWKVRPTRS